MPAILAEAPSPRKQRPQAVVSEGGWFLWKIGLKMGSRGYREFELPDDWEIQIPKDPFDRMIIAQTSNGNFTVTGVDRIFDDYGLKRVW